MDPGLASLSLPLEQVDPIQQYVYIHRSCELLCVDICYLLPANEKTWSRCLGLILTGMLNMMNRAYVKSMLS